MKCEHLISDENDECYPCKVKALFRIIGEREEELKLVSEQRDLIAEKADSDNSEKLELRGKLKESNCGLNNFKQWKEELRIKWLTEKERAEKAEKERDHWESLWKKSSMSVIGLQESNKELDKLKGFLSVERNKVEGWVEKCAEKDKRIGMLREALDNTKHSLVDILKNQELEHSPYWEDVSTAEKVLSTQPKPEPSDHGEVCKHIDCVTSCHQEPTTPSVPSEGE